MKLKHFVPLACVLSLLALALACGPAQAVYGASVGLGEAITVKRDIARAGELSAADERQITLGLRDANNALIQVTDTAECFNAYTTDAKKNVLRGLDNAITSLDNLNESGTLHIKSSKAQSRFRDKIRYAKLTATGIRTTLALIPAKDSAADSPLPEEQQRKLDELRALCRRASEQLHQNDLMLEDDLARLEGRNPEK
jgi:hypothetical protein